MMVVEPMPRLAIEKESAARASATRKRQVDPHGRETAMQFPSPEQEAEGRPKCKFSHALTGTLQSVKTSHGLSPF
jgi:hypothetical protein